MHPTLIYPMTDTNKAIESKKRIEKEQMGNVLIQ